MSSTIAMTTPSAVYMPTSDVTDRHDYGVNKSRKAASTGGGRAWSEDEEVYLLQTRLQKMPYKHIAAHLKKTELACRLHYHQLSHGSNRRKRTTSMSSSCSSSGHSPILPANMPSPIREAPSRSVSPLGSVGSYGRSVSPPNGVQLPSLVGNNHSGNSPRLPSLLPKPAQMSLALQNASPRGYTSSMQEHAQHSAPLMPSASFVSAHTSSGPHSATMAPLRLDCSGLPSVAHPVDMARLHAVYSAHRSSFWSSIAADYGNGVHPSVLEQAWKTSNSIAASSSNNNSQQIATPITPGGSPDDRLDKTRISSILGIDANPRSPKEREMVRQIEERAMVGVGA